MSNRVVTFDCETTTTNKGNPYDPRNRLCSVGVLDNGVYRDYEIEYANNPYSDSLQAIKDSLESADLVVGFNLKFDLAWIRRYIGDISIGRIWDCQLADYISSNQKNIFPSLGSCCDSSGLGSKLDVVRSQYWENGIDTPDIPYSILSEYLEQDVRLTYSLYEEQNSIITERQRVLLNVGCEDLRWLGEAEWNGLPYDVETSHRIEAELIKECDEITVELSNLYSSPHIDWNSSDHISIVLFGGRIYYTGREQYTKELKTGPVIRERNAWFYEEFKQQLKPDKRSENAPLCKITDDAELAKINEKRVEERMKPLQRTFSVAEDILRNFSPRGKVKRTIELLLRRSELRKLISTYYGGIPKIMEEHQWSELHGSFNQVGTRTGRLSSSKPNLQNFAGIIKPLFRSRYE